MFAHRALFSYSDHMATEERRSATNRGSLTNAEAAALIRMILDNTSTSAPSRPVVPDSPKSLADLFPDAVLAASLISV